ncbi:MAG: hypothetical protein GY774_21595 [Planctomycetes bacterium]|nr:hypothetical protein [Planctomycetota bacterium]
MKILIDLIKINCPLANLEFTPPKRNIQGKNVPEETLIQINVFSIQNDAQDRRRESYFVLKLANTTL